MKSVTKFNALHGTKPTREEILSLVEQAKKEEQFPVVERLETVLSTHPTVTAFSWENDGDATEIVPNSLLGCLDYQQDSDDEYSGLGKAVSPSDVYDLITNKMIELIKNANSSDYKKKWEAKDYGRGYTIPFNFVSKKRYRGVNVLMLTGLQPLENPFFLTFKQVKDLKGTVKKGAKGFEVVYFTKIWKVEDKPKNAKFSSYDKTKVESFKTENGIDNDLGVIPMLKYYHVYNGSDIEGIDFKLETFKTGFIDTELPSDEKNRLPIAEAIVKNYPSPQPILKFGGDRAFYQPGTDKIQMPFLADFDTVQDYYRTLLHEYSHSTGAYERLNRDFSGRQGSKPYAFEELVAELGATFLSAEAGIIWHTNKNHAAYLKGWNAVLTQIQDDNKFIMRASTLAQKLADFVLQFDTNGDPLYFKDLEKLKPEPIKIEKPKADKKPVKKVVAKPKSIDPAKSVNPESYSVKPKSIAVATAIKDVLTLPKFKGIKPMQANLAYNIFKEAPELIYEPTEFEAAVLRSLPISFANVADWEVSLNPKGIDFITAVKGRLESLRNQKTNYAFFNGLTGTLKNPAWFPKYTQFENKPKQAIQHLLKVKKGDCTNALFREDIGFIDIVWGENDKKNKGFGLKHIVEKHGKEIAELGFKIEDFIPIIVQFGNFKQSKENSKIELVGNMFKIVVSKVAYDENKKTEKTFVLTAFDLRPMWKKEKSKGLNGTYDGINFMDFPMQKPTLNFSNNKVTKTIPLLKSPALKSPVITKVNSNSLAERLKNKANSNHEYYKIDDPEIANFLGKIEKKHKESVAITLAGGQGSMKTRFCFRLMNAFAQNYKVGHASIEEHPESKLYEDKIHQYLNEKATNNISAPEIENIEDVHKLVRENDVIIIDSFSKLQEMQRGCALDKDFRKAYNGKLFIIIYQLTTDGKMRGGSSSQFDGDVISFIEKKSNYQDNYVYFDKNRYSDKNLEDLKYNIFSGKMERPTVEATPEPIKFSFNVIEK